MLPMLAFKAVSTSSFRSQLPVRLAPRTYATISTGDRDAADLSTARSWYSQFNRSTIPTSIAKTKIVKASNPGASKGKKMNPKVVTLWPMKFLLPQIPKLLHAGLYSSSYYVPSLDAIQIDCDIYSSQHENGEETQQLLEQEVRRIYKARLAAATTPMQEETPDGLKRTELSSIAPSILQACTKSQTLSKSFHPDFVALQRRPLRTINPAPFRGQLGFPQQSKLYSSGARKENDEADLETARAWFRTFNESTIPTKLATTDFVKSSGPGGQKTNKTSSKAASTWDLDSLLPHIPKILHPEIRDSRYYVRSSNSIAIKCDTHRNRNENERETHKRLFEEITKIYKDRVPGATSFQQKTKVAELYEWIPKMPFHPDSGGS